LASYGFFLSVQRVKKRKMTHAKMIQGERSHMRVLANRKNRRGKIARVRAPPPKSQKNHHDLKKNHFLYLFLHAATLSHILIPRLFLDCRHPRHLLWH
jgi:hypothetical protein